MTSDDFGTLTLENGLEGIKNDFQLWLINSDNGLIQNKRTGMFLKTDAEGNVMTFEDLKDDFYKWKLLLPNATFTVPSKIIKTPFGDLDITDNKDSCKSHLA